MTDVKPGQIWADNDWRSAGRTLRVERIENGKAVCMVVTNMTKAQQAIDRFAQTALGQQGYECPDFRDMRGKATRISLARFKQTSTGYRLVSDGGEADR